jgi:hypothetical protein
VNSGATNGAEPVRCHGVKIAMNCFTSGHTVDWKRQRVRKEMAGTTRLELATSAVTGQRSNQLNYVPAGG